MAAIASKVKIFWIVEYQRYIFHHFRKKSKRRKKLIYVFNVLLSNCLFITVFSL